MPSAIEALNDLINSKQKAIAAIKADIDAKLDVKNQLIKHIADSDKDLDTLSGILKEHEDDVCKIVTIVQELRSLGCIKESFNRETFSDTRKNTGNHRLSKIVAELQHCCFSGMDSGSTKHSTPVYTFVNPTTRCTYRFVLYDHIIPSSPDTLHFSGVVPGADKSEFDIYYFIDSEGAYYAFKPFQLV